MLARAFSWRIMMPSKGFIKDGKQRIASAIKTSTASWTRSTRQLEEQNVTHASFRSLKSAIRRTFSTSISRAISIAPRPEDLPGHRCPSAWWCIPKQRYRRVGELLAGSCRPVQAALFKRVDRPGYSLLKIRVFECKQARSDFLKDSHSAAITIEKLKVLDARRRTLERLLGMHQPSLRKGESLFAEYDVLDMSNFEHKTYRRVLRQIQILQARLYGKTKFEKLMKYRCANLCYLVVEEGILKEHEVPLLWGFPACRG